MKLYNDVWETIHNEKLDSSKYFYHYTSINKAIKILYGNCLKFSKLNNLNDTLEWKPKISNKSFTDPNEFNRALNYFEKIGNNDLQLLCFSMDSDKDFNDSIDIETRFTDYSGRGFALPRMWAQYADNNNGVCLIFERRSMKNAISSALGPMLLFDNPVRYVNKFKNINLDDSEMNNLLALNETIGNERNRFVFFLNFIKNNLDFTKYNYFTKLDDWSQEHEYRFLALGDDEYYVTNISEALAGIVIGEKIDKADENIILSMCNSKCDIMKINFSFQGCNLQRIYK